MKDEDSQVLKLELSNDGYINDLKILIGIAEKESKSFWELGNKAAGRRLRSTMLKIKKVAQSERISVLLAQKVM